MNKTPKQTTRMLVSVLRTWAKYSLAIISDVFVKLWIWSARNVGTFKIQTDIQAQHRYINLSFYNRRYMISEPAALS